MNEAAMKRMEKLLLDSKKLLLKVSQLYIRLQVYLLSI